MIASWSPLKLSKPKNDFKAFFKYIIELMFVVIRLLLCIVLLLFLLCVYVVFIIMFTSVFGVLFTQHKTLSQHIQQQYTHNMHTTHTAICFVCLFIPFFFFRRGRLNKARSTYLLTPCFELDADSMQNSIPSSIDASNRLHVAFGAGFCFRWSANHSVSAPPSRISDSRGCAQHYDTSQCATF